MFSLSLPVSILVISFTHVFYWFCFSLPLLSYFSPCPTHLLPYFNHLYYIIVNYTSTFPTQHSVDQNIRYTTSFFTQCLYLSLSLATILSIPLSVSSSYNHSPIFSVLFFPFPVCLPVSHYRGTFVYGTIGAPLYITTPIWPDFIILFFSQKQLPRKMKSRLVIIECADYIFWQLFLRLLYIPAVPVTKCLLGLHKLCTTSRK